MKKFIALACALLMVVSLTACGKFECDLCQEEKSGKKNTAEILGEKITYCSDCKDALNLLGID